VKKIVKAIARALFLALAFLPAASTGFGAWKPIYLLFAHVFALGPGLLGDYLRTAFYHLTLTSCAMSSRISFGAFFAHPEARVGERVYIGPYCVLGRADIGDNTQIASAVQILSGSGQHVRDQEGRISGSEHGAFTTVKIGADCWIGAAAIVMADVGARSTIGAGSVVTREIPPGSVATGVPARVHASA
jgi:virginiamycin A acetyltransferase